MIEEESKERLLLSPSSKVSNVGNILISFSL